MRMSFSVRRRPAGRHVSGPDRTAGRSATLRIAAAVLGLAMVAGTGAGAVTAAQATTPEATASAVDAPSSSAPTAAVAGKSPAAVDPAKDSGTLLAPEGPAVAEAPAEGSEPAEDVAATENAPAPSDDASAGVPAAEDVPGDTSEIDAAQKAPAAPQPQSRALAARLANPTLPAKCGLNMAIVLDLSNSLSDEAVVQSKDAAKSVVNSLRGTPSAVGVYTFGTFAPDKTNEPIAMTSVSTTNGADTLNTRIGQIKRVRNDVGGTNWDAAVRDIPKSQYDIVLFVTDGNPTAYGTPSKGYFSAVPWGNDDYGSRFDAVDLSTAVTAADTLKASGTFVMGLAVGKGINKENIQAISGPRAGTDYFEIDDYDKLTAKLTEIALKNCQGTVSIVKQVRELDDTLSPAAGWTFNGRVADNVSPASAVTGNDGAVNFKVNDLAASERTVEFTEVQKPQFVLESQAGMNATCINNVTNKAVETTDSGKLGFTVKVKQADAISCVVINAKVPPVNITVTKTWVNAVAGDTASFRAKDTTGASTDKTGTSKAPNNGTVITTSFAQGTTVNVAEVLGSANKGVYTSALKCTNASGSTVAEGSLTGSFVLGASDVTCAFTNTNTAATVVVGKKWIVDGVTYDNGKQPKGISAALTLTGPGAAGATAEEWEKVRSGYSAGNTVTIAETTTFDSALTCKLTKSALTLPNASTPSNSLPHVVTLAAAANSYTITNTVECTTQLTLLKFIDGSNGGSLVPGDFTLKAAPDGGTAWGVAGANTVTVANTKPVAAGVNHRLSESSSLKPAYLQLSLQRYTGTLNADSSLANPDAWEDTAATNVSVATGHHGVYRFVNASVPTMTLPLTGGTGSATYLMVGGGFLLLALLVTAWILMRRGSSNRA